MPVENASYSQVIIFMTCYKGFLFRRLSKNQLLIFIYISRKLVLGQFIYPNGNTTVAFSAGDTVIVAYRTFFCIHSCHSCVWA